MPKITQAEYLSHLCSKGTRDVCEICDAYKIQQQESQPYDDGQGRSYDILDEELYDDQEPNDEFGQE